jgi:hypothetical protein
MSPESTTNHVEQQDEVLYNREIEKCSRFFILVDQSHSKDCCSRNNDNFQPPMHLGAAGSGSIRSGPIAYMH